MELKKNRKILIIIFLVLILSTISTVSIQYNCFKIDLIKNINIWLYFLVVVLIIYVFSHFLFKIKDIYNFILSKRYIIAVIILFILVMGKFNGSSLGMWNKYIQPSQDLSKSTIVGKPLKIRSDEFLVNLSYTFSQFYNDFKYRNDNMMSGNVDMFTSTTAPVKDLLIITKPFTIGYLFLGKDRGLSFYWYGRLFALILITFEFLMIITKKNKLESLLGTLLIAGSSAVCYWYSNYIVDLLISSQFCLVIFNVFLNSRSTVRKIVYSILIGIGFSSFALVLYPAWQIPLGYMSLIFAIHIFMNNFKDNKKLSDYKFLLITIVVIAILLLRFFYLSSDTISLILNTVYPGNRISTGGNGFHNNFNYIISGLFPFKKMENPCEPSSFFSMFPLTLILSFVYIFKNRKKFDSDNFLLLFLSLLSLFFTIFSAFKIPTFIAKTTFMTFTIPRRLFVINSLINCYILIILLDKIKECKLKKKKIIITLIFAILITIIEIKFSFIGVRKFNPSFDINNIKRVMIVIFAIVLNFSFMNLNNKKLKYVFILFLIFISLINILAINPVNIGTDQIYNKDFSNEIRKINRKNPNSKWLSLASIFLSNYLIMNGANSINSTNIYPDLKLWKKLDVNKKYNKIYNRYVHIKALLTKQKTSFKLLGIDYMEVNLNYNDLEKIGVDFIVVNYKLSIPLDYQNNFDLIYNKKNVYIYKYINN